VKGQDHIYRSFEDARDNPPRCPECGKGMEIDPVIRFSFTSFRSFKTQAFNSRPGQSEIEVTDRAQLRRLLRSNRMVEMGDSAHGHFGSDPKSMPTWEEICKHGQSGGDPELAKLVKTGTVDDMEKLDLAADQTDFGRKQSATRPEFVVGRP
jgi:hypothetical protein